MFHIQWNFLRYCHYMESLIRIYMNIRDLRNGLGRNTLVKVIYGFYQH